MKEVFRDFLVFSSIAIKSRAYLEAKTNSNRLGITRFLKYITCFIILKNDSKAIFFINKVNGFYHFPVILAVLTVYNKFHFKFVSAYDHMYYCISFKPIKPSWWHRLQSLIAIFPIVQNYRFSGVRVGRCTIWYILNHISLLLVP